MKVKKGGREIEVWKTKTAHADNHYLDCEVYACTAADLLNVRYLKEIEPYQATKVYEEVDKRSINNDWIEKKDRWI